MQDRDFNQRVGRRRDVKGGRLQAPNAGPLALAMSIGRCRY